METELDMCMSLPCGGAAVQVLVINHTRIKHAVLVAVIARQVLPGMRHCRRCSGEGNEAGSHLLSLGSPVRELPQR